MQWMQKNARKLRSGKLSSATRILGQNTALQKVIFSYSLLESKKATKVWRNLSLYLTFTYQIKNQLFVAFLENLNFNILHDTIIFS